MIRLSIYSRWCIQVYSHRRNARFRVLCEHLVPGIGDDRNCCFGEKRHLPFLPFNTNHFLACTRNEQHVVRKSFYAIDQTDVEISVGIDSVLNNFIRSPRTISPESSCFWTAAFTAIPRLRMVAALIHVQLIRKIVISCVIIRIPDVVTTGPAVNGNDDRVCRVTKGLRMKGDPASVIVPSVVKRFISFTFSFLCGSARVWLI